MNSRNQNYDTGLSGLNFARLQIAQKAAQNSSSQLKLVVGIDFGTTYSGIAWGHTSKSGLEDIEVVCTWPRSNDGTGVTMDKVPSEIAYPSQGKPLWGYGIRGSRSDRSLPVHGWFKLHLNKHAPRTEHDDFRLDAGDPSLMMSIPPGKTGNKLVSDYLNCIHDWIMENLHRELRITLKTTPIEWVLTVPANWGHDAQNTTKMAARAAGIGSRASDTIEMISEPEAAALYALKEVYGTSTSRTLEVGQQYVIVDAGGGTVDLITHEICQTSPSLKVKEAVVGSAGMCGATAIDRAFHAFLQGKFGRVYGDWTPRQKGRGSKLMLDFEKAKRSFGHGTESEWYIMLPGDVPDDEEGEVFEGELILTEERMKTIFDPTMAQIIDLVKGQVEKANRSKIMDIILVGGFGESPYVFRNIDRWAQSQSPKLNVINPRKSWSAVVRGAVYSKIMPVGIMRKLKRHYGFKRNTSFVGSKHDFERSHICRWTGKRMILAVKWNAALGDTIEDNGRISTNLVYHYEKKYDPIGHVSIIGCRYEEKPADDDVGNYKLDRLCKITYTIDHIDLDGLEKVERNGTTAHVIHFTINMIMKSADIEVEIISHGKKCGHGVISYDS